uniref:Uncharacterized protein n=1 Tax=Cairina moschata TaxID=8855 RepID=A0A8C3BE63_CAIMO
MILKVNFECSSGKEGKPEEIHSGTFLSIAFPLWGLHLPWPHAMQPSGMRRAAWHSLPDTFSGFFGSTLCFFSWS